MNATDVRQTDVRQHHRFMPPRIRSARHNQRNINVHFRRLTDIQEERHKFCIERSGLFGGQGSGSSYGSLTLLHFENGCSKRFTECQGIGTARRKDTVELFSASCAYTVELLILVALNFSV